MRSVIRHLSLVIFFLFFFALPVRAENELLPAGRTIESDYFRAADQVQIDGTIAGDAFLVGGLVTINGRIEGDLFVVGGKVTINGEVGNSVRVFGGDAVLNGPVGRNVALVCGNCAVSKQASVSGSLLVAAGNAEVAAPVIGKGFRYFGGRLYLNSPIVNEAFVVANQEFILGPQASVSGDLKYTGNNQAILQQGATVAGKIAYEKINREENFPRFFGASGAFEVLSRLGPFVQFGGFVVSALLGVLFLGLFPKYFEKVAMAIERQSAASFGWGILVLVMMPVIAILLAVTIVGIPVSLVLVVVGYFLFVAAQFVMAFVIGRKILLVKFGERRGWAIIVGLFVFFLLGFLPIIGRVIYVGLVISGLGGIVLAYRHKEIYTPKKLPVKSRR